MSKMFRRCIAGRRWSSTVLGLTFRIRAMALVVWPSAINCRIFALTFSQLLKRALSVNGLLQGSWFNSFREMSWLD